MAGDHQGREIERQTTDDMKNPQFEFRRIARKYSQLFLVLSLYLWLSTFQTYSQDFKSVHDGVEYAEVTREISGLKVNMNLLRLDLTKVRLNVHHAMDSASGTEKTSSIAKRHGAIAAINAGFFRLDSSIWAGDAAGALAIDRKILSEPHYERIGILIFDDLGKQTVMFSHLQLARTIIIFGKSDKMILKGINRERLDTDDVVVYTPEFHRTTLTNSNGAEAVIRNNKVTSIAPDRGSSVIPNDGWVLSVTGQFVNMMRDMQVGQSVKVPSNIGWSYEGRKKRNADVSYDATNGVPQLIKDGKIDITWEQEKTTKAFVETRHPRTAVAKLKDGKFLMITVDGRSESSGGIGLQDLAEYLLSIGAVDAMNLDGGGSTTMFLDGKVVNHPSDKEGERKVGDAILVTLRQNRK